MLTLANYRILSIVFLGLALAACDRLERASEFSDAIALGQDKARVHLVSRELSEAITKDAYPAKLNKMQNDGMTIDADPMQVQLVIDVTIPLVKLAQQIYPYSKTWDWDVHVVDSKEVNAWCMAGGKMVVYTGLLYALDHNPDKLAAVMGHEIAHALLEHSRRGMGRDLMLSSGLWIASKSMKIGAQRSDQIAEDLSIALQPFRREQEREADVLGMELIARAGFDLDVGSRIWEDLGNRQNNAGLKRLTSFYSSHPLDDERLAGMADIAQKLKRAGAKQ